MLSAETSVARPRVSTRSAPGQHRVSTRSAPGQQARTDPERTATIPDNRTAGDGVRESRTGGGKSRRRGPVFGQSNEIGLKNLTERHKMTTCLL